MLLTTFSGELDGHPFSILSHNGVLLSYVGIDKYTAIQIVNRYRKDIYVDIRHWFASDHQCQRRD